MTKGGPHEEVAAVTPLKLFALPLVAAIVAGCVLAPVNWYVGLVACAVGFVCAVGFGIPCFLLFSSRGYTGLRHTILSGAISSALPPILLSLVSLLGYGGLSQRHDAVQVWQMSWRLVALTSVPLVIGVTTAVVYWLVAIGPRRREPTSLSIAISAVALVSLAVGIVARLLGVIRR